MRRTLAHRPPLFTVVAGTAPNSLRFTVSYAPSLARRARLPKKPINFRMTDRAPDTLRDSRRGAAQQRTSQCVMFPSESAFALLTLVSIEKRHAARFA